jgi:hypothetical protein
MGGTDPYKYTYDPKQFVLGASQGKNPATLANVKREIEQFKLVKAALAHGSEPVAPPSEKPRQLKSQVNTHTHTHYQQLKFIQRTQKYRITEL